MIDNAALMSPYGNDPFMIIIDQLNSGTRKFIYSDIAERVIGDLISRTFKLEYHSPTWGYNPGWDYQLNGHKVEQKITGLYHRLEDVKHNVLAIEYSRGTGEPSGILKSQADLYVTLSPAISSRGPIGSRKVGKLRMFKTQALLAYLSKILDENDQTKLIEKGTTPEDTGKFVLVDSEEVAHYWLGDVRAMVDPTNWIIGYHVENFIDGGELVKKLFDSKGFKNAVKDL